MCQDRCAVVVELPAEVDPSRSVRTISCDRCMVEVLQHLWKNHIQTLGCCCGHDEAMPSIVISDGYSFNDIDRIEALISEKDARRYNIMQRRLICVNNRDELDEYWSTIP